MDYFKQRRAYRQFRQNEGTVSSGQNNVYRELLDYANDEGHLDGGFKLKNSALVDWTGMTLQGVIKARNELAQKGLIEYAPGMKNKSAPTYRIICLYYTKDPQSVHQVYNNQFTNRITAGSSTVEQLVEHKDLLRQDQYLTKTNNISPAPDDGTGVSKTSKPSDDLTELWLEYQREVRPGGGLPSEDARAAYTQDVAMGWVTKEQVLQKIHEYKQYTVLSEQVGYEYGAKKWFEGHCWRDELDLSKPRKKQTKGPSPYQDDRKKPFKEPEGNNPW